MRLELKFPITSGVYTVLFQVQTGVCALLVFSLSGYIFPVYANPLEIYCISKQRQKAVAESELSYSSKKPPTIDHLIKLPNLNDKPCSFLASIWGSCEKAPVIYSSNLNRFFMTGHRVTPFGTPWTDGVEIVNGKVNPLPEKLYGAELVGDSQAYKAGRYTEYYHQDIPNLKGVLFRGYNGDALFYDGWLVYSLLDNYLKKSVVDSEIHRWEIAIAPISKRIFLSKLSCYYRPPSLVELKAGGVLMSIDKPYDLTGFMFYEFPQDLQLIAVGRRTVAAEIQRIVTTDVDSIEAPSTLRTVIIVPEPSYIQGGYIQQASDGTIRLLVHNPETKVDNNYFIVRKSPSTKCLATLNPKKPIVLYDE